MIRLGFLDAAWREDLTRLARDGSAARRPARRANALPRRPGMEPRQPKPVAREPDPGNRHACRDNATDNVRVISPGNFRIPA
jgi:uncharacterized phage protein gp47/JayE